ncbi:MAG: iron transporter [Deltaproteobacteria bacterium]|nr:iron transporter [Deltaproteobacteria bacterium]
MAFARTTLKTGARDGLKRGWEGFLWMVKIIVPVSFFTALLEFSGLLDALNFVLEPAMGLLNLPSIAALPLVVGMLSGIYTGIAAMTVLPLTTNQMTLIAVFLMISHNLVQEGIIQAKSGLGALKATLIRLAASVITVIVVSWFLGDYSKGAAAAVETVSHAPAFFGMLKAWFTATLLLSIKLFIIIISIMILLEIMRIYHIITYMVKILTPVLKIMGLEKRAGILWLTAVIFGLSYGAAVIVSETKDASFNREELENLQLSIGINHAIIEDPGLFMSLGLNPFWLWVPRFLAAIVAVHLFSLWQKIRNLWRNTERS